MEIISWGVTDTAKLIGFARSVNGSLQTITNGTATYYRFAPDGQPIDTYKLDDFVTENSPHCIQDVHDAIRAYEEGLARYNN